MPSGGGPEQRDRIIAELEKRPRTYAEVAQRMGVAEVTVERLARANGLGIGRGRGMRKSK